MKYIFSGIALSLSLFFINVNADGLYDSVKNHTRSLGESIEKVNNIPVIDKLTNLLPFALLATCLKECPGQTAVVFLGLAGYIIMRSESIRCALYKYNVLRKKQLAPEVSSEIDDSFFVFEDDDQQRSDGSDAYTSSSKFL